MKIPMFQTTNQMCFSCFSAMRFLINVQPVRNVRGSMRVIQAVVFAKGVPTQLLSVP
jgi:hypothetical protein